jgi:hypothetical protein
MADRYGFIEVKAPPGTQWLTQQIIREYAAWLFSVEDDSYPSYQDGKPYNQAAQIVMTRHVEKEGHLNGFTGEFDGGSWYEEVYAKESTLQKIRYQDDFEKLRQQMIEAFGIQNLVRIWSFNEAVHDLEKRMKEADNASYIPLIKEMRHLRGWTKVCPHCGGDLDCDGD